MTDKIELAEIQEEYPLDQRDPNRVRRHLTEIGKLGIPVIFNRTGVLALAVADFAILGRTSSTELAYFTLGQSPFIVLLVIGIGLMLGTLISTSHAYGENLLEETGAVWRRSLPYGLIVGCVSAFICLWGEAFFTVVDQPSNLIQGSATVTAVLGLSLIPTTLFLTSTYFLEAIKRPKAVTVFIIIANILNAFGNEWVVDDYGAEGVAWITTLSRTFLGIGLTAYVWFLKDHATFSIRKRANDGWWRGGKVQRRHGYAAGMALGFETSAFGVMSLYAGWLGEDAVAIYGVCMNILALCFMLAVGVATATGVRVGVAHGRKDWPDRKLASWLGFSVLLILLVPVALVMLYLPETVLSFYLTDPELIGIAIPILAVVAFLNIGDGGQVVIQSTLRACEDKWVPTAISFVAFFIIMVPAGYIMTQIIHYDVAGLFYSISLGSFFALLCFLGRVLYIHKQGDKLLHAHD
ncbi:MATE family efflux transporter [Curvivirga sp.]|uniref:MATE family efflux transporter n=1 Tax=Curvivirga sp. TaxID=2856848 RepID=UPI003B5D00FC